VESSGNLEQFMGPFLRAQPTEETDPHRWPGVAHGPSLVGNATQIAQVTLGKCIGDDKRLRTGAPRPDETLSSVGAHGDHGLRGPAGSQIDKPVGGIAPTMQAKDPMRSGDVAKAGYRHTGSDRERVPPSAVHVNERSPDPLP
jgi:hypothetical protein